MVLAEFGDFAMMRKMLLGIKSRAETGPVTDPSHLHGPYPTWIRKVGTKTVTGTLSPAQLERYRPLFDNTRRLRELITELEALSAQAVEHAEGWTAP